MESAYLSNVSSVHVMLGADSLYRHGISLVSHGHIDYTHGDLDSRLLGVLSRLVRVNGSG